MFRHTLITGVSAAALIVLSSCSAGESSSEPDQPSTETTSSVTEKPSDPSVSIDQPKNLAAVSDPCSLITGEQVKALGVDGKPESSTGLNGAKKCTWAGGKFDLTVSQMTALNRDAEAMYNDAAALGHPERYKVEAYPAATIQAADSLMRLEVAVNQEQTFTVDYTKGTGGTAEMEDAEGYSKKIASEVLKNIPDA